MSTFNIYQRATTANSPTYNAVGGPGGSRGPICYYNEIPSTYYGQKIIGATYNFYLSGVNATYWNSSTTGGNYATGIPVNGWNSGSVSPLSLLKNALVSSDMYVKEGESYTYHTVLSAEIPYFSIVTEPIPVRINDTFPAEGTRVVRTVSNTFSWNIVKEFNQESYETGPTAQASAAIEWRETEGSAVNTINVPVSGTSTNFTVPANTFTSNNIQYRVRVTSNGGYTAYSDWISIITDDVISDAIALTPNMIVDDVTGIQFTWEHSISTGTDPTASNLQYSRDNGIQWIELAAITGPARSWRSAHNQIPSGSIVWRVRTRNSTNHWGIWSKPVEAIVRVSLDTPVFTSYPGVPKPTFVWNAAEQSGFELTISDSDGTIIYDSREIFSSERRFTYPGYLLDGNYTVKVRVMNLIGARSDWGSADFDVINAPTGTITAQVSATCQHTMVINWHTEAEFDAFYVLRGGEPIAKLDAAAREYEDTTANGKNTYTVRGIKNPYYADSNNVTNTIEIKNAVIALFGTKDWLTLERLRGSRPTHTIGREPRVSYRSHERVRLPAVYRGIQANIVHTINFTFNRAEYYERLLEMENKTVIYKDCMGQRVIGNMTIPSSSLVTLNKPVYDFEINITEIHVQETVAYE